MTSLEFESRTNRCLAGLDRCRSAAGGGAGVFRPLSFDLYQPIDSPGIGSYTRPPRRNLLSLAEWRDVLRRAFNHRTHYLVAEQEGEIRGVLPLAEVRRASCSDIHWFPRHSASTAASSHSTERRRLRWRQAACDLARQLGVDHLEMRNRSASHPTWPCKDLYVTFRKADQRGSRRRTCSPSRAKQRAMVRKGIKEELARPKSTIPGGSSLRVYSESLRNLGTPVFAKRYLRDSKGRIRRRMRHRHRPER